ncbi:hypothetical protein Glove_187g99 [Diversispora epigaea]|uniref:Glycosyltransferase family 49 protein n=1 Tax=Diversispora epigaea TaxID=1348612 RepID=A0A397IPL6_9GLOM|nr:hypothetical protein Glove_187g99 [Diversispora epigaea]
MWPLNKSQSNNSLSPQFSFLRTYFLWLWKSKILRYILVIYIGFSIVFSLTQLAKYTFEEPKIINGLAIDLTSNSILRTYDTKKNSPLSEIKNELRFSKMHVYSPRTLTDRTYPYYFRANNVFKSDDITVTAFITQNRLDDLVRLANTWRGPISATLDIPSNLSIEDPGISKIIKSLKLLYEKHSNLRNFVDIHLITGSRIKEKKTKFPIPTNFHLNVARFFARTELIFYLDHDTWPSLDLHTKIKNNLRLLLNNDILIIPTFAFINKNDTSNTQITLPNTKKEVRAMVKEEKMGMQDYGWEFNNGPTCVSSYFKSKEPYMIEEYDLHYKPNFISKKNGRLPWCTERFENNKAACLFQMYLSGSNLFVIHDGFLVNHNFNPNSHLINHKDPQWQKIINSRMYTNFSREKCLLYARQFVLEGKWKLPIANHVKEECQRVLTSWGSGLIKSD